MLFSSLIFFLLCFTIFNFSKTAGWIIFQIEGGIPLVGLYHIASLGGGLLHWISYFLFLFIVLFCFLFLQNISSLKLLDKLL